MRIPGTEGHRFDQWSPRTEDIMDEPSPVTGIRRLDGEDGPYVPSIPH